MAKKDITNEDLAVMIKKGFDGVDKRFEKVDKRFEKVDKRLEKLEQGQERIELRMQNLAPWFEVRDLQKRLQIVEKRLGIKPNLS